jgi:hypothetical protein
VPSSAPADVVVMDNLSAQKVSGVQELIQAPEPNGCTCRPIPQT